MRPKCHACRNSIEVARWKPPGFCPRQVQGQQQKVIAPRCRSAGGGRGDCPLSRGIITRRVRSLWPSYPAPPPPPPPLTLRQAGPHSAPMRPPPRPPRVLSKISVFRTLRDRCRVASHPTPVPKTHARFPKY
ncbi:unnamed protein product, partial [Iphiclides podalirius]